MLNERVKDGYREMNAVNGLNIFHGYSKFFPEHYHIINKIHVFRSDNKDFGLFQPCD